MLLCREKEFVTQDGNKITKNELIAFYEEDKQKSTLELLINNSLIYDLYLDTKISLAKTNDYENPVLIVTNDSDAFNITQIYALVEKNKAQLVVEKNSTDEFKKQVENNINNITKMICSKTNQDENLIKYCIKASINHLSYLNIHNIRNLIVTSFANYDKDFIENTSKYFRSDAQILTKNLFMEKATDKVSLKLPTKEEMLTDELEWLDLIPYRDDICKPYPQGIEPLPNYKMDPKISKSLYSFIEGDIKNNALDIQDNEKDFYDSLITWVKERTNDTSIPQNDDKNFIISSNVLGYLHELIGVIYSWHWQHNKNVPNVIRDHSDDQNDDSNISSKYAFRYVQGDEYSGRVNAIILLIGFLQEAEKELGYRVYPEVIVKLLRWGERKPTALVLEGYPYAFELGTSLTKPYLGDINDYEVLPTENGCDYEAICFVNSKSPITDKRFWESSGYTNSNITAPVCLVLQQVLVNKKDRTKKQVLMKYLSILDVIRTVLSGKKIDGIAVDECYNIKLTKNIKVDNNLSVKKLRQEYLTNKNNFVVNPFYISNELKNLYITLGVESGADQLSILEEGFATNQLESLFGTNSFSTKEEMLGKLDSYKITSIPNAIMINVFKNIYQIFIDVFNELNNTEISSMDGVLNLYKDKMIEYDYSNEASFFNVIGKKNSIRELVNYKEHVDTKMEVQEVPGKLSDTNKLLENSNAEVNMMNSFEKQTEIMEKTVDKNNNQNIDTKVVIKEGFNGIPEHMLYDSESKPEILLPVKSISDVTICYIWRTNRVVNGKSKPMYILYSIDYANNHQELIEETAIKFNKLIYHLLSKFFDISKGKTSNTIKFYDNDTFNDVIQVILDCSKQNKLI